MTGHRAPANIKSENWIDRMYLAYVEGTLKHEDREWLEEWLSHRSAEDLMILEARRQRAVERLKTRYSWLDPWSDEE